MYGNPSQTLLASSSKVACETPSWAAVQCRTESLLAGHLLHQLWVVFQLYQLASIIHQSANRHTYVAVQPVQTGPVSHLSQTKHWDTENLCNIWLRKRSPKLWSNLALKIGFCHVPTVLTFTHQVPKSWVKISERGATDLSHGGFLRPPRRLGPGRGLAELSAGANQREKAGFVERFLFFEVWPTLDLAWGEGPAAMPPISPEVIRQAWLDGTWGENSQNAIATGHSSLFMARR